jgi:hypothetical protein
MTDERSANGEAPDESPAEAMDRLARQLEGVERRPVGKAIEYTRAGVVFAAREDGRLSFRLREEVVGAALRTLDTGPSARGADWISLWPGSRAPGDSPVQPRSARSLIDVGPPGEVAIPPDNTTPA